MITVNSSLPSPSSVSPRAKVGRPASDNNSKHKAAAAHSLDSQELIHPVNPFLFLQEIDNYKDDKLKLKVMGDAILRCLNDILLGLLDGKLQEDHIRELTKVLENNRSKFKFLELQEVIDSIILRAEIELAKIESIK